MQWFKEDTPFWLPRGSIRAGIIIIITWAVVFPIFKLVVYEQDIQPGIEKIIIFLAGALTGILKDYMTVRKEEDKDV